jgi:succinate dehydrogenase / fumarate reductase flavoprotein subunit
LKSTIATFAADGEPVLTYEDVDTSLIPPRPRLYGLVGADVIEQVWKERQHLRIAAAAGTPNVSVAAGNGENGAGQNRAAAARATAAS